MENKTKRVLIGEEQLRQYALAPLDFHDFYTASDVVVEEIDNLAANGRYPYNAIVQRAVEARLGLERQNDNGSPLSRVVYASQGYRDYQKQVAAGFVPFTQAVLEQAFASGAEIESTSGARYGVRRIDGKLYAMKPRKRKHHMPPQGQAVRLVSRGSAPYIGSGGPQVVIVNH